MHTLRQRSTHSHPEPNSAQCIRQSANIGIGQVSTYPNKYLPTPGPIMKLNMHANGIRNRCGIRPPWASNCLPAVHVWIGRGAKHTTVAVRMRTASATGVASTLQWHPFACRGPRADRTWLVTHRVSAAANVRSAYGPSADAQLLSKTGPASVATLWQGCGCATQPVCHMRATGNRLTG